MNTERSTFPWGNACPENQLFAQPGASVVRETLYCVCVGGWVGVGGWGGGGD